MKRNASRTGPGNRSTRQEPHCAHGNLGRGRGGNCGYGRRSNNTSTRPVASLVSSVIGGILELADNSIRKLSTGIKKSNLLSGDSDKSATNLPDLQFRREEDHGANANNRQLTQNNEESKFIADK